MGSTSSRLVLGRSVARLRELNQEISFAWLNAERVAALKTSIKVARLLSDTSVPHFYPTLFVLVTEVMDTVGRLVYDRIRNKVRHGQPLGRGMRVVGLYALACFS